MQLYKLNLNSTTVLVLVATIFTFTLLPKLIYAAETNTDLNKICDRQSILIAAKIRSNSNGELTAQDMSMIRLGAINGCLETYRRIANTSEPIEYTDTDKKVVVKTNKENQESSSEKESSILDILLRDRPNDDVNPMQQRHRTGGK